MGDFHHSVFQLIYSSALFILLFIAFSSLSSQQMSFIFLGSSLQFLVPIQYSEFLSVVFLNSFSISFLKSMSVRLKRSVSLFVLSGELPWS